MEDLQLKRAVELLREDPVWENLLNKYHKAISETQVAFSEPPAEVAAGAVAAADVSAETEAAEPAAGGDAAPEE